MINNMWFVFKIEFGNLINNILLMEAYKPYVNYLTAGGVAETVYVLSKEGAVCGTNLPIK